MVYTSSHLLPFRSIFILGNEKSLTVQGRENMEVAARVGLRVWLRNVAHVQASALVHCRDGFAVSLTTTFLFACCVLRRGDASELVNNIPYYCVTP